MTNVVVLAPGDGQVPNCRTEAFHNIILDYERLMKKIISTPDGIKAVFRENTTSKNI